MMFGTNMGGQESLTDALEDKLMGRSSVNSKFFYTFKYSLGVGSYDEYKEAASRVAGKAVEKAS